MWRKIPAEVFKLITNRLTLVVQNSRQHKLFPQNVVCPEKTFSLSHNTPHFVDFRSKLRVRVSRRPEVVTAAAILGRLGFLGNYRAITNKPCNV